MLMTSSDLAASTKQWHVQQRAARLVTDEFIEQGDKERFELKIQPQALMDRERQHELPQLQIRWIADICLPLYQVGRHGQVGCWKHAQGVNYLYLAKRRLKAPYR